MATYHSLCKTCGKIAVEVSRLKLGTISIAKLKCGHSLTVTALTPELKERYLSHDGKELFPFQDRSVDFIFSAGGRALIAHEQGLGKTVIALAALSKKPEMLPFIVVCKTNLSVQWFKQTVNWITSEEIIPQVISSSKDHIFKAKAYIISYDLLRRMPESFLAKLEHVKTVILDEVQHIKNPTSKRANNVRDLCANRPYVIALSGTPIKNNAGEYFSVLNLLHPERFPSKDFFYHNYVDTYWDGYGYKVGGLSNVEGFRRNTEDFILRYEQKDVLPDLPALRRDFQYYDIDSDLRKEYDKAAEELTDFLDEEGDNAFSFANYQHILAFLNKMRQITGIAKVGAVADHIADTLLMSSEKILIFLHHHIARDLLIKKVTDLCKDGGFAAPLAITDKTSQDQKEAIKHAFRTDASKRILILGTLSSGEGLDGLQDSCSKMIMMERQWNPANEEQAEKRLHRIGQNTSVLVIYPIAIGTVDELFTDMVEKKRQITKETYGDSDVVKWDESSTIRGLVEAIQMKRGGKRWTI